MNLLTIKCDTKSWKIQIENVKYIISDVEDSFDLLQALRLFTAKEKSEYRKENNIFSSVFINEKEIEAKSNLFIEISDTYSLNEDKKLTTKSLMLKYLESRLQSKEYFDTISTIDILLNSLSEEVNEDSSLKVMFNGINYKQLIKMLTPMYEDQLQKDEYDLTRENLIVFQLDLIKYIAEKNSKYDNIFIYGRLDCLSNYLVEKLNDMKNIKTIIFVDSYNENMRLKDIYLYQNELSDFANLELFYNQFSQIAMQIYTLQEVEEMIINYLQKIYTHKKHDIYQELSHFSIK